MQPLELIAAALALFTLASLYAAFNLNRRLVNLRANCLVRNKLGHVTRYANASPEVQARVESIIA